MRWTGPPVRPRRRLEETGTLHWRPDFPIVWRRCEIARKGVSPKNMESRGAHLANGWLTTWQATIDLADRMLQVPRLAHRVRLSDEAGLQHEVGANNVVAFGDEVGRFDHTFTDRRAVSVRRRLR